MLLSLSYACVCVCVCLSLEGYHRVINIPGDRKWKLPDKPRRLGGESGCPTEKLVDVQKSVNDAVKIVEELKNKVEKVPPIVISRLFRGGKTTLIDLIAHKLSQYR